ncbi:hypothetical protein J3R30DRAFT_3730756 [Lentinula aciculospora]|uniref:Uncharacterized protein n=1 Tax=Lentinula aciculospora TaxID=153920 RepID=A0A9W9DU49_9AGAR|nr:hypothetical protein J3R30DRAFT_3730756 [Lentinula aciculospora]
MIPQILLALFAVFSVVVVNGAAIVGRDVAFNNITAEAASLFGDATNKVDSEFQAATSKIESVFGQASLPSGFVQTVTSDAGHIESIVTSLGGQAITLASSGQGLVTSFAGTHFTVATSSPTSSVSGSPVALATSSTSSGFMTVATSRPLSTTSTAAPSSTASQKNNNGALAGVHSVNSMLMMMIPVSVTLATLVGGAVLSFVAL